MDKSKEKQEENSSVRLCDDDIKYIKKLIERIKPKGLMMVLFGISGLMLILAVCIIILCAKVGKTSVSVQPVLQSANEYTATENKILIISIEQNLNKSECSDQTQVEEALQKGGMIRIGTSVDTIEYSMGDSIWSYGASTSKGEVLTYGALFNYVASKGWKLIQAPIVGISDRYYFSK